MTSIGEGEKRMKKLNENSELWPRGPRNRQNGRINIPKADWTSDRLE